MEFNNEDILRETRADFSAIPANMMSFSEAAGYIAEATEKAFNEMFEEIGIHELAVYESTGSMIVYEAEEKKNFKTKFVDFFKALWARIKGLLEKASQMFENMRVKSIEDLAVLKTADIDKIADGAKLGKVHEYMISDPQAHINAADTLLNEIKNKFQRQAQLTAAFSDDKIKQKENADDPVTGMVEEFKQKIYKTLGDDKCTDMKSVTEAVSRKLMKDGDPIVVTKEYLKKNLYDMQEVVVNGSTKNVLKAAYKKSRKVIDEAIKAAKKYDDERSANAPKEVECYKCLGQTLNLVNAKTIDICKKRYIEFRNALFAANRAAGKAKKAGDAKATDNKGAEEKKEQPVNASYQYDLIKEAFSW